MKRPFLLLYINDFLGSPVVQAMDDNQFRWYLQLLMRAWQFEIPCHVPSDEDSLMLYAGCKNKKLWRAKSGLVMSNFDPSECGKYVTNSRLIAEYEKLCKISDKRADAARIKAANALQKSANAELCRPDALQNAATPTPTPTLTKPKPKTLSPAATDGRYKVLVEDLQKYWITANRKSPVPIPFTVSKADGRNIKTFLERSPKMGRELWQICLQYRARSPAVVHSTPICEWILSLLEYAHGPLDRFNKPEGVGHASKVQTVARANSAAAAGARELLGLAPRADEVLPQRADTRAISDGRPHLVKVPGGEREGGD